MVKSSTQPTCSGAECGREAGSLQYPTCPKLGLEGSYFCSQECFKINWASFPSSWGHGLEYRLTTLTRTKSRSTNSFTKERKVGYHNPFPSYPFTGPLSPVYPLSQRRPVPDHIRKPDWWADGIPKYPPSMRRANKHEILDLAGQIAMRKVCRLAREVLDIAAAAIRPGITTDQLDAIVHDACIKRGAYPSPLNYNRFPKSLCTSPNEVIFTQRGDFHPTSRVLLDGDIVNIDVSLFYGGYHGNINETYYVGERALADPDSVRVVETARECLDLAIRAVKPGQLLRDFGAIIERHAKERGCGVVKAYCGHGIHKLFHCQPDILHYARNKAVGVCKPGMTFTIEPMVALGSGRDVTWPDGWTATTVDGKRTA
ncbi:methionine aminopeptidase [Apodospora peruviana]|uniref:Methionine aminopeptidase n=1 Tax=Apodospora peruviana TaxID=516989 RepID=A0AAE0IU94_9PEZI|nr:methionine aminopeptidase [Apodospora peruviana]